jgi:hypothetical protein
VAEKFADGLATTKELITAQAYAWEVYPDGPALLAAWTLAWRTEQLLRRALDSGGAFQADLLRHLLGNPWRPVLVDDGHPDHWPGTAAGAESVFVEGPFPPTACRLAECLYAGEPCAFALHDVLLESGYPVLAGHFAAAEHPKGCWALDLILGKQ